MITPETIRERVEHVTQVKLPFDVCVKDGEGLHVRFSSGKACIEASEPTAIARGFFHLTRMTKENRDSLDVHESRHFKTVGPMLDMSRNAVLRPERVKAYIDRIATLGMNMLMLYTEDTYEVPEYPLFGAMRGRFTQSELKDIDAYARESGVELIPCVQTLAHLGTFLRWGPNGKFRDQPTILMADEEETYQLIEAMVRSLRESFSTDRIHIGMDEAHGVGLGNYLLKHGMVDRFELLSRHLNRVTEICQKYGFHPMMWSDMFFRLGSKYNEYYDKDVRVPDSVIASLPPCDMVYWDYYHDDETMYDAMLTEHERMGQKAIFAGGNWTWSGFVPQAGKTIRTMVPGLRVASRHMVDTVIITEWGDDGNETNTVLADFMLPLFSESCWQGPDVSEEEMRKAGMCLTGLPYDYPEICDAFYPQGDWGKGLIWADPLLPLLPPGHVSLDDFAAGLGEAERKIDTLPDGTDKKYLSLVYLVAFDKATLLSDLKAAYLKSKQTGKREILASFVEERLPVLQAEYHDLMLAHREQWMRDYKPQGWEMLAYRYGGMIARLEDAALALSSYIDGDEDTVPELEEAQLPKDSNTHFFASLTSAGASFHF